MIDLQTIISQLPHCLGKTDFPMLGKKYEGKVRDNYIQQDKRIIIGTDRLSAFDRIICLIPFKGQVLNQISQFWFQKTDDIIRNHVISYPDQQAVVALECQALPVEMVIRGYLTGVTKTSVWYHYEQGLRNFCGNMLPEGMRKNQKFEDPIITPSTKAPKGQHDESISPQEVLERKLVTPSELDFLMDVTRSLFQRGQEIAHEQGIILVDTKYEFGRDADGNIILIDEIHTPDSSRFWFKDSYQELFARGEEQKKIDKEYLREWLAERGFRGDGEIPAIPDDVRAETSRRYIKAYELITGMDFEAASGSALDRIEENLQPYMISHLVG